MRKRKRQDTYCTVYKYWARPIGPLPEHLWEVAHGMKDLWNRLVDAREAVSTEAKEMTEPDKKVRWKAFQVETLGIVKESGLNWECGPAVLARFETACRVAAKTGRGWPKIHHRIDHILIPHRFTAGGAPSTRMFSDKAKRFSLSPVSAEAYVDNDAATKRLRLTRGSFGLDDVGFEFETILHRQLPVSVVKAVAWCGVRHPARKTWEWSIVITLEQALPTARTPVGRTCGIDVGWRIIGDVEDYIRIGMLADSTGNSIEFRLPLRADTAHDRRHNIQWTGWRDLAALDATIADLLELTKSFLSPFKKSYPALLGHLTQMRQGGLIRVLAMAETDLPEIVPMLTKWKKENDRLRSIRASLWERLTHRRHWIYRNLARWIVRNYDEIAIEDKLDIKAMIEDGDKSFALKASDRWHQVAATSELLLYIRQAAITEGVQVIKANPAYSSVACSECGSMADQTGKVVLECGNGHRWDQDVNAARNLLTQTSAGSEQKSGLRKKAPRRKRQALDIPIELKAVANDVHSE